MPAAPIEEVVTGLTKAAILLILLGDEAATSVYKNLNEAELQRITEQVASLQNVSPKLAESVLQEYYQLSTTQETLAEGGPDVAAKLLSKAFGAEVAKELLQQVMAAREET